MNKLLTLVRSLINQFLTWYHAMKGDSEAQYAIGSAYRFGEGVPQDYKKAFYWLTKAAERGNTEAMFVVGVMFIEPDRNKDEAYKWITKAAEQGHVKAQTLLVVMHDDIAFNSKVDNADVAPDNIWGIPIAEAINASVHTMLTAAEKDMIENPRSFPVESAVDAIECDNKALQWYLGCCYHEGRGVTQNLEKALDWYFKSAEQNHKTAQFSLGEMYFNGDGVPKDNIYAYTLFYLATSDGVDVGGESESYKGKLAKKMTPEQIAKAQQMASDWLAGKMGKSIAFPAE